MNLLRYNLNKIKIFLNFMCFNSCIKLCKYCAKEGLNIFTFQKVASCPYSTNFLFYCYHYYHDHHHWEICYTAILVLSFCFRNFSNYRHRAGIRKTGYRCSPKRLDDCSVSQSVQSLSCVQLFVTPWITVDQASLSITNFRPGLNEWRPLGGEIKSWTTYLEIQFLSAYLVTFVLRGRDHIIQTHSRLVYVINWQFVDHNEM